MKIDIAPISLSDEKKIALVAQRMKETLIEVLGEDEGATMYDTSWLINRVKQHLDGSYKAQVFVAENKEGHICGHTIVRIESEQETGEKFGLFSTIYVDPDFRERNVASRLIDVGEEWIMKNGLSVFSTYTSDANHKLISLYTKRGYRITHNDEKKKMVVLFKKKKKVKPTLVY